MESVCLPNDLLAADMRHARLLTFAYSSDVLATFHAVSQNKIMLHAQNLLLVHFRCCSHGIHVQDSSRPIVFVWNIALAGFL